MESLNTSDTLVEPSSPILLTQTKLNNIRSQNECQNMPQPLKFRSFDAFYQYYSKKQTYENSLYRNSISYPPIHNTTLKDKKETLKNEKVKETKPVAHKPTFTYTTEDYNIKGRVKRLCEIFQKARDDSTYRVKLEKVISKNKISKSPHSGSSSTPKSNLNVVTHVEFNSLKSKDSKDNVAPQDLKTQQCNKQQSNSTIYFKRDQNTKPSKSLSPLNFKPDVIPQDSEELLFHQELKVDLPKDQVVQEKRQDSPSPKASTPLKEASLLDHKPTPPVEQITTSMFTHRINAETLNSKSDGQDPLESNRLENEALVNDILSRFMNDPDFCDTFFSKLEGLNLYNSSNALQFSKVIDELQFLVENDNNLESLTRLDSNENKKDFEWFFNQPKVFDFNSSDLTGTLSGSNQSPEQTELDKSTPSVDENSLIQTSSVSTDLSKDYSDMVKDSAKDTAVVEPTDLDNRSAVDDSISPSAQPQVPDFGLDEDLSGSESDHFDSDPEIDSELIHQFDWIKLQQ